MFIYFDECEADFAFGKLAHLVLDLEAIRAAVWVTVSKLAYIFTVARCVSDVEGYLDAIQCPSKFECLVEASLNVFWKVTSATRHLVFDGFLNKPDVVGKVRDFEAIAILNVSVGNKGNLDGEAGVRVLHVVYNFTQCILGAPDPGAHGRGAIEDEAKIESLLLLL